MNMQTIIIIGATSGIGRTLFEKYASDGNRIGIVGRRTNLLDELRQEHPDTTVTATADITKQDEIARAIETLCSELKYIDLAIVCSGLGDINASLDYAVERPTINTNVTGWTFVIDTLYHIFEQQGHGHLVAITSAGGLRGEPMAPAYSASVSRWPPPTAHRKPIKSTTWKPCARRLIRAATIFISPTSVLASSIQQWPKAKGSSG